MKDNKHVTTAGCGPCGLSRRQFLAGCAACAAAGGQWAVGGGQSAADIQHSAFSIQRSGKPKVRLVFCETANTGPIWPNIGYDFDARRKQLLQVLTQGCPDIELLPTKLMDDPKQAAEVVEGDHEVDGYLVCIQGLGWGNDIAKLSGTGKPTLLVDNLFGGSGLFLTRQTEIMRSGRPVDWVSSSEDQDIVASARNFALLGKGKTAAEVAAAFRATRRKNTPTQADWTCKDDPIPAPELDKALKQLRQTKILVVGGGWGGDDFRRAAKEVVGVEFVPIGFEELSAAYDKVDQDAAQELAQRWTKEAQEVVEPTAEDIQKSAAMYLAMKQVIDKQSARGISINCLGGFYGGQMKAYPCLGFTELNNAGLIGGCEADQMSALTMATMGALVGRPGYISDPVIDTSRNMIIYAHCVGMTKPFGPAGATCPCRIRSHSEDRKGAVLQSLLPEGYMTTTLEIDPLSKQVLLHQAKSSGNNPSDMACRTKLEGVVKGDLEKLTENWSMGWHRVTFYGDLKQPVEQLCKALRLKIIEEA
jgi:hypothetical protein